MKWPTLRWIGNRAKDLFYGPGNVHLDLGRLVSFWSVITVIGATCWNVYLGKPIELQQLGLGLGAVITACAAFIKWKDAEKRKADEQASVEAERGA
jgi:hypothetical protein